jgi:hypothetical protein
MRRRRPEPNAYEAGTRCFHCVKPAPAGKRFPECFFCNWSYCPECFPLRCSRRDVTPDEPLPHEIASDGG